MGDKALGDVLRDALPLEPRAGITDEQMQTAAEAVVRAHERAKWTGWAKELGLPPREASDE